MKNLINNVFLVAVFAALLASCKPELTTLTATKGSLNLTSYVAIGNSLTSGFQNGGLFYAGQKSSYANVLAEQFKLINPNLVFNTPYVEATSVGYGQPNASLSGSGFNYNLIIKIPAPLELQSKLNNCTHQTSLVPSNIADPGDTRKGLLGVDSLNLPLLSVLGGGGPLPPSIFSTGNGTAPAGPYQNMGVPGARCIDVNVKGYGGSNLVQSVSVNLNNPTASKVIQSNPYFSRFAKSQTSSSMLSDALLSNPTFFTLFIGNNDVLLWASVGGTTVNGIPPTPLTNPTVFADSLKNIVTILTNTATQGVILNVPQITGSAFFTYHPADTSYYIVDENSAIRKMKADELILLTVPADSLQCGLGGFATYSHPIPKQYTLTESQIDSVTTHINAFNASIEAIASEYKLAFFDMNAFTKANQSGSIYNGMSLSGTFVTGGIFGLDGLHLTPRGYASVANELITVINKKYGSTIPGVDLTKYGGVVFPQ